MFFNIFVDPEVIDEASKAGSMGIGRLCEHLFRMQWDCILTDTYDEDIRSSLALKCKDLDCDQFDRKKLGELIIHLWRKKPQIYIIPIDAETSPLDLALKDIKLLDFDILISPRFSAISNCGKAELSNLTNLHKTKFASARDRVGTGVSYDFAEASFEELCDISFKKLVRYAKKIALVDYSLGAHQDGTHNQHNGVDRWIKWLNNNMEAPGDATLEIHTIKNPEVVGMTALENQLNQLRSLVGFKIELKTTPSKHKLPHQRYLMVDKHWVKIDRGFDLADSANRCRECSFSYSKRPKLLL